MRTRIHVAVRLQLHSIPYYMGFAGILINIHMFCCSKETILWWCWLALYGLWRDFPLAIQFPKIHWLNFNFHMKHHTLFSHTLINIILQKLHLFCHTLFSNTSFKCNFRNFRPNWINLKIYDFKLNASVSLNGFMMEMNLHRLIGLFWKWFYVIRTLKCTLAPFKTA